MYSHSTGVYKGTEYEGCKTTSWNPDGSNMMFQDLSFPVFLLTNETEVNFAIHDVRSILKIFYAHCTECVILFSTISNFSAPTCM